MMILRTPWQGIAAAVVLYVALQGLWYSAIFVTAFRQLAFGNAVVPQEAVQKAPRGVLASAFGALVFVCILDNAMSSSAGMLQGSITGILLALAGEGRHSAPFSRVQEFH